MKALFTANLLSPNIKEEPSIENPRHHKVRRKSMICSVQVLALTCLEPKVAVSTFVYNLEHQSIGVMLSMCKMSVTEHPITRSCMRCVSTCDAMRTSLPHGVGESSGTHSCVPVQHEQNQSIIFLGMLL